MAQPIEQGFRPSPQQRRVWRLQRDGLTSCAATCALRLEGDLDRRALRQALADTVARHEILRTAFRLPAGLTVPLQVILEPGPVHLPEVDCRDLSPIGRAIEIAELLSALGRPPFALERGEGWRAALVGTGPREHELLLALSAACADAGAFEPLAADLLAAYARRKAGGEEPPEPPLQYADVAEWQNSLLEGEDTAEGVETWREHWREHEVGARLALPLPLEEQDAAAGPFAPRVEPLPLAREAAAALARLAEAWDCPPRALLLASWMAVLQRGTGRDEALVGVLYAGRDAEELRGVIGPLARYLPIAARFSPEAPLRQAVARVAQAMAEAEPWGDYFSWDHVTGSEAAGFPVCFEAATVGDWELAMDGLRASPVRLAGSGAILDGFALALSCQGAGEDLRLALRYDPRRFSRAAARRLGGRLAALLGSLAVRPEAPLADHPATAEDELRHWLELSVAPPATNPEREGRTLHAVFAGQAERTPDRLAVVAGDGRLTFRELDARANRLAHHLRAAGAGPEVPVALCLERSAEAVVALLAVWKAGAAYVPLDPTQPAERLAFLLADTGAPLLVTNARLAPLLPGAGNLPGVRTIRLDDEAAEIARRPAALPDDLAGPRNLAYVIYTSGSTGRPKGVQVEHRSALHLLDALEAAVLGPLHPQPLLSSPLLASQLLASLNAPTIFDASVQQLVLLLAGHALCVVPEEVRADGAAMLAFLREQEVDLLDCTPSQLRLLVSEGLLDGPSGPRIVLTAGEAVDEPLWRRLAAAEGTVCFNLYGPTECSVDATFHRVEPGSTRPTIGRPLPGYEAFLLDRALRPVPPGAPGEICLGGAGLARGYLRRPGLTAERFLPHPFARRAGERLYRTGDLGRHLPDGTLEFLGRLDHQVKIRGFRIELGEIEAVLGEQPGVRDAVVVARESAAGDRRLVAYVAGDATAGAAGADNALRQALRERLPDYMVPAVFVRLAALPLTPGGKVDRKALPAPEPPGAGESYVAPRTGEEEILAAIWAQALRLPRVGVDDNFFELGGDSILSVQIVARARQAGLRFTVRQIFEHQTVAELARHATAIEAAGAAPAGQGAVSGEVPLTPIQRLFFEQGFADLHHFNQSFLLESRDPLSPAALERAMAALMEHHDALRLRLHPDGFPPDATAGGWRQENAAAEPATPFHQVDLSGLPPTRLREAFERAAAALQAGFDLSAGPLIRLALFQAGDGQPELLLWVAHHLVVDGVSWRVLLEDLEGAYRQAARGLHPTFPPKTTSFREWAHRLAAYARSEALARELDFWRETARATAPRLPVDFPGGTNLVRDEASVSFELDAEETADLLQTLPAVYHSRIDDALLSALVRALSGWTGSPRLRVDLEGHGREPIFDDLDISRTVGWFTTVHPVVLEAGGAHPDSDPGSALVSAKERLRAIPERGIGYGLLRHLGGAAGSLEEAPAAEISFNYLGQTGAAAGERSTFRISGLPAGPTRSPRAHRTHLLDVTGIVVNGRLRVTLIYGSRVHARETAQRLAASYAEALRQLIRHARASEEVFTPSDFPKARLDVHGFNKLAALLADPVDSIAVDSIAGGLGLTLKNVADIYPLSPLQAGMLFHSLMAPGSGVYVGQFTCTLPADLDVRLFRQAWERLVERHGVLRTVFVWDGLDEPRQVVRRSCALRWREMDWRGLPADEQQHRLEELRHRDRHTPLSFTEAPLMRFSLARLDGELGFIWTSHHLLMDGWSLPVLVQELVSVYTALQEGREPALPPARPFSDYIVWLSRQDSSRAEPFWRQELAGFAVPNPLGIDHPARQGASGFAEHRIRMSREVTAELQALAARHRLTLQTVTLGAWALLLSRYCGEEDVVFGNVVSGRPPALPGVETMIGMFINTLPVRVRVDGAGRLAPWLQHLQERQLARQELGYSPLSQIQRWSEVPAGLPLFESLYVFENYPIAAGDGRSGGLQIGNLRTLESNNYPVTLVLAGATQLSLQLTCDRARVDEDAVPRLLGHLSTLLAGIAAEGLERPLSAIPLLPEVERHQLRTEWNDTAVPAPPGIGELFAAQVRRSPDALAVELAGDERPGLTYRELDRRSDLLARRLRAVGVGPEVPVGLCVEQTPELAVAVLGIFKSGGALLTLDPTHPPARLSFLLADAAVPVLVGQAHLLADLPRGVRTVPLEGEHAAGESPAAGAAPAPGDLAYLIYTSGTTGQPKAVAVEHGMLAATLAATQRLFHFAAGDRMPCLALPTFDISLFELLSPLLTGGTAVLFPLRPTLDVELVVDRLGEMTCLHAVPALMREIVESIRRRSATAPGRKTAAPDVEGVRAVFVGGDQVPAGLLEDLRETFPAARVWVLYGPTEGTIVCAAHRVPPAPAPAQPLLGRPLAGAVLDVRDPRGELLPVGVPGELWIGGAGVTRGYLGRSALTAEKYVPRDGARFYRSGDRVRRRADGTLEFFGRLDHQVKVRGFRIELGEIEAALREHAAVREAVVDLEEHAGDPRLVAWVVPGPLSDGAGREGSLELWPSIGEYPVYDELIYHGLTHDAPRNEMYLRALRRVAAGKVVVDVGTGRDAILARLAIQAGARQVYAIEISEESYRHARELIASLALEDRVAVIHGDILTVQLPEKADVCVSEIVEAIGGAEGAAVLLEAARHLLGPGGVMVPARSVTRIAAVTLPDEIGSEPCFTEVAAHYVRRIFDAVGHPFDLRLCVKGFPPSLRLSDDGIFEDLDFTRPVPAQYERELVLTMDRAGRLDGLLVWLELHLEEEVLDILEGRYSWFPVYLPLLHPGLRVAAGDTIRAVCRGRLSDDGVHPDYSLSGHLVRQSGESVAIHVDSSHHPTNFGATPFYRRLFREGEIPVRRGSGEASLPQSLHAHLAQRLPEYMVPSAFVTLAALPLTPHGKVDRKALPAPEWQGAAGSQVSPRTPVEQILAGIWTGLLGVARVGRSSHFFDLGGHSLLATRVQSRLREAFGVELPLRDLFEAPVLADLALRVETALRAGEGRLTPPLVPVPRQGDPFPLSFAQQRLWFIDQLAPGSPLYNVPAALRVDGPVDGAVLALCLGEIVRRHEALRTVFAAAGGSPVQVIRPSAPFLLPMVDLSGLPEGAREAPALALIRAEAGRPFDLARGPLMRGLLLRLAAEDHAVALTTHHIVSDGWSVGILVREVAALYPAFAAGRPSPLPELPVQYADFAVWQRSWLHGEALESEISFWRRHLEGLPPLLELPTDRPRPAVQSFRGATRPVLLRAGLVRQLEALGRKEGATLFMVLLAGLQSLLARASGQDDLAVGSPVAGRNRLETEGLIGFFINTLVLRGDLTGTPTGTLTGRELLGRVREATLAAYLHQDVPFERLLEELAPERSLAHTPLFQVVLALQNAPGESLEIPDLRLRPVGVEGATAKFDLTVILTEHDGGVSGAVEYATDLFDATTVDRLIGHFERLLAGLAESPESRPGELPLLSSGERHQVLVEWNDTAVESTEPTLIHEPFQAWARRAPDAVALLWRDEAITYGRLAEQAQRLAGHLAHSGVGPGSLVGIHLRRGPDMIVALLAVLEAGAAYVPLEVGHPPARLRRIVETLEISCLLTETALRDGLPRVPQVICLDGDLIRPIGPIRPIRPIRPIGPVSPDALAYVIFTSGSTGTPKGVMVRHRPVVGLLRWAHRTFAFSPADRVLFVTSLSFDLSVFDVFGLLGAGGSVRIASEEEIRDPERLLKALAEEPITFWDSAPAALEQTVPFLAGMDPRIRPALRLAFLSGDWIPVTLPDRIRERFPGARVISLGGATEATVWSNVFPIGTVDPAWTSIPYGRPIDGARYHVLDARLALCPVGVAGDLYIGGGCLADGYAREPELTAHKFLPDPWSPVPGGRLYRTGDRARYRPDGNLEFLGRLDHQVKVRGFRIELGEIETALATLPGVREAAVVVREERSAGGERDRRLVAYVAGDVEDEALRRSLRERLPDYMVPAVFVRLAALPLTANGKVDRKALPAPEAQGGAEDGPAPRTPVEEILAGIWAELLGRERIGAHDHFFELGGHSLLATQVMSRLRGAFGLEMPVRVLFEAPALAHLAARVEEALRAGAGQLAPPLVPVPRTGALPLSFAQQRLWFIDQLEPGTPLYNLPAALRVEGALDGRVLALCLGEIVRRHESLRTVFAAPDGSPVQVIQPAGPFRLPVVDLAGLPERAREALLLALTAEEAGRPFDLARGPLLRGLLLRLGEEDHAVALTMHHIASDGWSMGILIREVVALYPALAAGRPSPLPELPVQYADFAVWQSSWLRGEVLEQEISYWRRQLAGLPPLLELPTDRPRPPVQSFRGAARPLQLHAGLTRRIEALGRREGATLFMVLLAGFQALLARHSGQQDLAVGTPVAGRNRMEIEGLIGFFVNTLVLRGDLRGDPTGGPTFRELLGRAREAALAAYLHQDVPFEKLVEELAPERSLAHAPLFQVMLALQNTPGESLEIPGLRLRPVRGSGTMARFDLILSLTEQGGGASGTAEYATDLYDTTTIDRLIGHLERLLEGAMSEPDRSVADLPLLSPAELHQARVEWSPAAAAPAATLVERFESWADRAPAAAAVLAPGEALTYGELEHRANQLARHLRALGVSTDSRVGLCVEPSPDMIVGILGILKAGAAYVPLDPAYPRERLAFMIEDARVPVLLTQEWLMGALPETAAVILRLDTDWSEVARYSSERLPSHALPESLAYTIYTSGSTGRPKGVMVPHRGWSNLEEAQRPLFGLQPGAHVLQFASLSFDASAWEIAMALGAGATLLLAPRERRLSADDLTALLWESTIAILPPTALATLPPAELPALETLVVGGEACPPELARRWGSGRRFFNAYGPTEASVCATAKLYDGGGRLPVGRPLDGVQAYVLDALGNSVPAGVTGELCLGGPGLARGYLGRPERTARSFVPHPFATVPGERLYRTGDLAYQLPGGEIELAGRTDQQVKIRGFRIEPGEVEAALAALPGVREAVVMAREERSDKRLVAYVVGDAPAGALRQGLRERLPDYMVPAAFVTLAALPLTPNGKIDRQALSRQSLPAGGGPAGGPARPRNVAELAVAQAFEDVLGVPAGVEDDFFALGGHSLLTVRLMARIRQRFGRDLPLTEIFAHPTVAALARRLGQEGGLPWSPLVPIQPHGGRTPLFCVHPLLGEVLCYYHLARRLGTDRPFYGIRARPMDGQTAASQNLIQEMAAEYLQAIRSVQPAGPYLLSGFSFGGIVAFEMAQQLARAGEEVALLALLDTAVPLGDETAEVDTAAIIGDFLRKRARRRGQTLALTDEELRLLSLDDQIARYLEILRSSRELEPPPDVELLRHTFLELSARVTAGQRYKASLYQGNIVLLQARDLDPAGLQGLPEAYKPIFEDPSRGWGRVATGGVEVHVIPGDHEALVEEPHVEVLAEALGACLTQAEQRAAPAALAAPLR